MQLYPHHPKQGPNMNVSILNTKDNCEYPQVSLYNFTPDQKPLPLFLKLKSTIRNQEYPQLQKQLLLSSTAKAAVSILNFKSNSKYPQDQKQLQVSSILKAIIGHYEHPHLQTAAASINLQATVQILQTKTNSKHPQDQK